MDILPGLNPTHQECPPKRGKPKTPSGHSASLDTDFTADIDIDGDTLGSIKVFHRYAQSEPKATTN